MWALSLVAGLVSLSSGCAMCCAPFDCDYPALAGRWVRHNPTSGRVGSAFDEAGGPADVISVSASEDATPTPPPARVQPAAPPPPAARRSPQTRSVIPRDMGETYLPRGN
jgi:hypothetical protein